MGAKLDMGKAWNHAVALLSGNRGVVLTVAGVFVFLPNVLFNMFVPQPAEPDGSVDPENLEAVYAQVGAQLGEYFASYWWVFIILGVVQSIGVLGLLTLLTDRARPTVGEALQSGLGGVVPYYLVQIMVALGFTAVLTLAFLVSPVLGSVLLLPAMVAFVYVSVKLSLTAPVIAIERARNPVAIIKRSWALTKGNSLRIFAYFLLLILVLIVFSLLASGLFSVFALMGDSLGNILIALAQGLLSLVTTTVTIGVLAGLYHQLTGGSTGAAEVFD